MTTQSQCDPFQLEAEQMKTDEGRIEFLRTKAKVFRMEADMLRRHNVRMKQISATFRDTHARYFDEIADRLEELTTQPATLTQQESK